MKTSWMLFVIGSKEIVEDGVKSEEEGKQVVRLDFLWC